MSEGIQSIGACIAVSAALPATHDVAGFAALTFTDSGEIITFGDVGPSNNVITFDTICDGLVNKRMGAQNPGTMQMTAAWDTGNGAQDIWWTKVNDRTKGAQKITLPSGDTVYFNAFVSTLPLQIGGSSDILRAQITLELDGTLVLDEAA